MIVIIINVHLLLIQAINAKRPYVYAFVDVTVITVMIAIRCQPANDSLCICVFLYLRSRGLKELDGVGRAASPAVPALSSAPPHSEQENTARNTSPDVCMYTRSYISTCALLSLYVPLPTCWHTFTMHTTNIRNTNMDIVYRATSDDHR